MKRLAIPLVLAVACGGKAKPDPGAGSGSGRALYAKKLAVSWSIEPIGTGAKSNVYLSATDETGSAVSYPLGSYDAACTVFTPAPEMKAATGVRCVDNGTGTELHVVQHDDAVFVLKLKVEPGVAGDPMAREEVTRIKAPPGAKLVIGGG